MAESTPKQGTLLPEQEAILTQMETLLDQVMASAATKSNGKNGFLNVHHGSLVPVPNDCDLVFDKVYMGGEKVARDISGLEKKGITHVVNCAQGKKFSQVDTNAEFYKEYNISYFGIPGHDSIKFNITAYFHDAAAFIQEGVEKGGGVYIHCHQGISRSTTIVIAYMMLYHKMTAVDALKHILQHRLVRPNKGFLKRLAIFQFSINERSVHTSEVPS